MFGTRAVRSKLALVSSGHPDLFVVCKNCGAEVSPYITECPYCGKRLRKRAPKLDREGHVVEPEAKRLPLPSLPRLRRGEIPGIASDRRPVVTLTLILLGIVGTLFWRTGADFYYRLTVFGSVNGHWWRLLTTPFVYSNTGYAFATLTTIAIFGLAIERQGGALTVVFAFLIGSVGGAFLTSIVAPVQTAAGANGAALALILAWALPEWRRQRQRGEFGGELVGASVFLLVIVLMPLATTESSVVSGVTGILTGLLIGLPGALRGRSQNVFGAGR